MKLIGLGFLMIAIFGCAPKPARVNFDCQSYVQGAVIITNCADQETWREFIAKQKGGT